MQLIECKIRRAEFLGILLFLKLIFFGIDILVLVFKQVLL